MPFKNRKQYNAYMVEYRKRTNQNAYMSDYRKRLKLKQQEKDTRLKELEERERELTEKITDAFKPHFSSFDPEKEQLREEITLLKGQLSKVKLENEQLHRLLDITLRNERGREPQ